MTSDDMAAGASALDRDWVSGTVARGRARREQVAAEAAAGAASLSLPAIERVADNGGEAAIYLRAGSVADIHVPGMGKVATIKAGDGWGTAVVSPRVLHTGTGPPEATPEAGARDAMSPGEVAPWSPGAQLFSVDYRGLPPASWVEITEALIRVVHGSWHAAQVHEEVYRIWREMCDRP
jgi:hypothetical protein